MLVYYLLTARSPLYSHISVAMDGHQSIKASKKEEMMDDKFHQIQDVHSSAFSLFMNTYLLLGLMVGLMLTFYFGFIILSGFLLIHSCKWQTMISITKGQFIK